MSRPYTVVRGDTLSAIARHFGLKTWQELYNNPENAAFRAKRPNPDLILPGDVLMVPGGASPPKPQPTPPQRPPPDIGLIIVPFTEAVPLLIARRDHDPNKSDLANTPSTPTLPSTPIGEAVGVLLPIWRSYPDWILEQGMRQELVAAGFAGLKTLDDFITNRSAKKEIEYGFGNPLSDLVRTSPEFRVADERVRADITLALTDSAASGVLDYHVLSEDTHKVQPPKISFGGFQKLHVLVGSAQGIRVLLEEFSADETSRTYNATLIYEIFDHFGADDDDIVNKTIKIPTNLDDLKKLDAHGTPGQIALWILQRERHPGHEPFVVKVVVETKGSGRF